jgi:hypothetical protein
MKLHFTVKYNPKNDEDFRLEFVQLKFLIDIILIPLLSFIGFLLQFSIIYTVNKNSKELKDNFYFYIRVNSGFNCLFSFLNIINMISLCYSENLFCSSVRKSYFAQYFKLFILGYISNVIKMLLNLSDILITVHRYMRIGQAHLWLLEKIAQLSK